MRSVFDPFAVSFFYVLIIGDAFGPGDEKRCGLNASVYGSSGAPLN